MIFLGSRRAWELLAPNPFAEQDSILRWQRMAGALHENRSEVQLKLPRRAFKRTRKVIVGFAHTGMLVFRRVAAQHKKSTTFHRGLLKDVCSERTKASFNEEKRIEVVKDERILSGQEHCRGVRSVGEAAQRAALCCDVRHGIEKLLEHRPVGTAHRVKILRRNDQPTKWLVRIQITFELRQVYADEVVRPHQLTRAGLRIAATTSTAGEKDEERELASSRVILGQLRGKSRRLLFAAGHCHQRVPQSGKFETH